MGKRTMDEKARKVVVRDLELMADARYIGKLKGLRTTIDNYVKAYINDKTKSEEERIELVQIYIDLVRGF